jgi:hypothetical protein
MKAFSAGGIEYLDQIMLDYPAKDASSILGQWCVANVLLTCC